MQDAPEWRDRLRRLARGAGAGGGGTAGARAGAADVFARDLDDVPEIEWVTGDVMDCRR